VMSDVFAHIDRIASFDACVGPQAKAPPSGPVRRQNSELGKKRLKASSRKAGAQTAVFASQNRHSQTETLPASTIEQRRIGRRKAPYREAGDIIGRCALSRH
jgi:hypothetical protein